MRYIETFREGLHISDVYLCKNKQIALTKAGKEYGNLILQDKTGTIDAKIWDLNSPGVGNFETMDYVYIDADVTMFQNSNQLNVKRVRKAEESEYIPYIQPFRQRSKAVYFSSINAILQPLKQQFL